MSVNININNKDLIELLENNELFKEQLQNNSIDISKDLNINKEVENTFTNIDMFSVIDEYK